MSQTDTIADFITCIRNASSARKESLECPLSGMRKSICEILKREGFIRDYRVIKDERQGMLKLYLKYAKDKNKTPAITSLEKISKPGLRMYKKMKDITHVLGGRGIAILSTSKGILTDSECRELKIGGEPLCNIW
ncbi:MAG: 30S ribosomal protein S8 [Candidatus Omnitrophica bacterium]|jgi:small subunit ribosomal protein S8|nr:30S ribosomal protein S8 [Candidatus Omnitrophota bacterium]